MWVGVFEYTCVLACVRGSEWVGGGGGGVGRPNPSSALLEGTVWF